MAIIQLKRGSSSSWVSLNPVLAAGEPGFETDTNKLKIGNGSLSWNSLPYLVSGALRFRGTLGTSGTVTSLPSIYDSGWTYKIITAGTYAGHICEVGDLIISTNDRPIGGGNDSDWTVVQDNLEGTFYAAPEWTENHTSANGTRYLIGDLVYRNGNLYRAKADNDSEPVTNTAYWENVGPGYRLNIDGEDIENIPFPVTNIVPGSNISVSKTNSEYTISSNVTVPVTNIIAGNNISVSKTNGEYTISADSGVKINNTGNNRILTNDGTAKGINAESNFIYNDVSGTVLLRTEGINNSPTVRLIQASENKFSHPSIELRRNRDSLSSPNPLTSGDHIGSISFTTLAKNDTNSFGAEILAYTDDGLSTYDYVPTILRFGNRMTDGSMNYIYVHEDGTFNPRNGAIINDISVGARWTGERAEAVQIFSSTADSSILTNQAQNGLLSWVFGNVDPASTSNTCVGTISSAHMVIPSGVTLDNASILMGSSINAFRNPFLGFNDNGTLNLIVGCGISYGHLPRVAGAEPQTKVAYGISLYPWAGEGNIENVYDILIANASQTQQIDKEGTTITGDGTISNRWGILQQSNNPNILNGSLTINNGLSAPKPIHNLGVVSGNVSISYAINKLIQTITLNGTSTNFIEGSDWPTLNSGEILLEISATNNTSVTWTIVDDWYSVVPSFVAGGKYVVLLRNVGSTMHGYYIGSKTN